MIARRIKKKNPRKVNHTIDERLEARVGCHRRSAAVDGDCCPST